MAPTKISELPAAASANATDQLPANQGGATRRLTLAQVLAYVQGAASVGWAQLTGKPTTLAGYGITDAASDAELSSEATTRANADSALDTRVDALEAAPPAHTHDDRYYTEAEIDTLLAGKADDGDLTAHASDTTGVHGITDTAALVLTDDVRLTNARTPTAHAASHATAGSDPIAPADIGAAAASHSHAISDTTGLQTALDGKAASSHTHAQSDVTNLTTDLALKAPLASPALTGTPTAPTATAGTNTTQLATTAFVTGAVGTEATARADADTALDGRVDALETAPPAHAASHGDGGADELTLDGSQVTTGTVAAARLPAASTSAAGIVELATSAETTAGLAVQASDTRLSDARTPTGGAGGVLSGTYPNPGFAVDMATQAELDAHASDTTSVHGIADTSALVLTSDARLSRPRLLATFLAVGYGTGWVVETSATEWIFDFFGRAFADLTGITTVRLAVGRAGGFVAAAKVRVQYTLTLDGSGGWADLVSGGGPQLTGMADNAGYLSDAGTVVEAARTLVLLRIVGLDGDGVSEGYLGGLSLIGTP